MAADYYKVLGIDLDATEDDIRRSFRRLAKKYHPDVHRGNKAKAERAMRLLIQAYKTLMDQSERMLHDARMHAEPAVRREDTFLFRMRRKRNDPTAQTRLMLYCLLHDRADEGLEVYETLGAKDAEYDPRDHLDGRDHLDLLFLIAELYEQRDRPREAAQVYEDLYRNGNGDLHGAFYYRELQDRLRSLYFRTLPRRSAPRQAIAFYRRGLKIRLPRRDKAFARKKMAECYFDCDNLPNARWNLDEALRLVPKLKGIKKITEKLAAAEARNGA